MNRKNSMVLQRGEQSCRSGWVQGPGCGGWAESGRESNGWGLPFRERLQEQEGIGSWEDSRHLAVARGVPGPENVQWLSAFRWLQPWTLADMGLGPRVLPLVSWTALYLWPCRLVHSPFWPPMILSPHRLGSEPGPLQLAEGKVRLHSDSDWGIWGGMDDWLDRRPEPDSLGQVWDRHPGQPGVAHPRTLLPVPVKKKFKKRENEI